MSKYIDKYNRFHNQPVTEDAEIPSNNGWIYTAYAKKLGIEVGQTKLSLCFKACSMNGRLIRSPRKPTPPISRDEILGMAYLGFLKPEHLKGWNFSPYPVPKFNLFKFVKQLVEVRGKHRNYFWLNNLNQIYRFAFSVPLTDRAFILEQWGKTNLFYTIVAKIDSALGKDSGIRYLKYGKSKEAMLKEFPEDHMFRNM